jgi:hypothetical protein
MPKLFAPKLLAAAALLAVTGLAHADTGYTVAVVTDTATALDVVWTWDYHAAALSSTLEAPDLQFWAVTASARFDGAALILAASGQHMVEPHAGTDTGPAPTFFDGLTEALGAAGSTSAMAPHLRGGTFTAPADFGTLHWDHYLLSMSSTQDAARIELAAAHPVPEPSAYAMLLAGAALVGALSRRRT